MMLRRWWLDIQVRLQRGLSDIAVTEPGSGPCWRDWVLVAMLAMATVAEWIFAPYAYQAISAAPIACAFAMLPFRRQMPLLALVVGFSSRLATDAVVAWQDKLAATAYAHVVAALVLVYALFRWSTPLAAVATGLTKPEIASALYVSLSTAKAHVANLMTKLHARNRVELVVWANQTGRAR